MKRDITVIPVNELESLLVASDNSGGIGQKDRDMVKTPYEVVSYYCFRVALMECMAAGGMPISVVIHNFCEDDSWKAIVAGVESGLTEIGLSVPITGSTESNFPLLQSALGTIVIGKRDSRFQEKEVFFPEMKLGVIGSPLVGDEVLNKEGEILPLSLFRKLCQLGNIIILPVGSKGVLHELKVMLGDANLLETDIICEVDVCKSGGPSTCILAAFPPELESTIQNQADPFYHPLRINY